MIRRAADPRGMLPYLGGTSYLEECSQVIRAEMPPLQARLGRGCRVARVLSVTAVG